MNELTQQGINALRSGDREAARALLSAAIKQNPNDTSAWLWLTGALDKDEERIHCLQQVLRIDPGNAAAARGLAQIVERRAQAPAAAGTAAAAGSAAREMAEQEAPAGGEILAVEPAPQETPAVADVPAAVETTLVENPRVEPVSAAASAAAAAAPAAGWGRRARVMQEGEQVIFRTRPSVVPALIGFWVFLIGAFAIGVLLREDLVLSLSLAIGMGFILEVIVIYAAIRNLTTRYELTNYQLTLRFRGQRVRVPVAEIAAAECRQSFFQQILGTGDLLLDGAVRGELAHLRLRNIPDCNKRLGQIKELTARK